IGHYLDIRHSGIRHSAGATSMRFWNAIVMVVVGLIAADARAVEVNVPGAKSEPGKSLTFTKDIAPNAFQNCVSCHRPGEVAASAITPSCSWIPWDRRENWMRPIPVRAMGGWPAALAFCPPADWADGRQVCFRSRCRMESCARSAAARTL